MKTPLISLLATAFTLAVASDVETQPEPCAVRAWVRAEDLSPDHVSRGELRIKVPRAECANQVASVALRLQLDEFGELKFLKKGAVLPEVQPSNQSAPAGYEDWMGSGVVYDYQAHDDGLSDPELWTVKAEERRAWSTEATLIENNPNLSQAIVTSFTVAVPAVNYPPVLNQYRQLYGPVSRHSYADLGYRYIAVVRFTDGRIENVLAGHTAFVPLLQASSQQAPFTWNTTFGDFGCESDPVRLKKRADDLERCLPERSTFVAEVTLEEGSVVSKDRPLKGRVTVRSLTDGPTTMSDISISLQTSARDHWAHVQAAAGGDTEFYNTTSECGQSGRGRSLDADSPTYASIFDKEEEDLAQRASWLYARVNKDLTPAHPYVDFEFEIPHDTPVDFTSYYTAPKNLLQLRLTVLYSADVAKCMRPDAVQPIEEESTTDDAEKTEEGLWDTYTRVGQPPSDSKWLRSMHLHATVPITIVGGGAEPARPIVHYLTPGAAAPVLRRGAQTDMPASFPAVQPVFTVEGFSNTSARLLQPGSTDPAQHMQQLMNMTHSLFKYPDPTRDYRGENFASLLWKKKVIAEERGIWPVRNEVVDGGDAQKPFSVVP